MAIPVQSGRTWHALETHSTGDSGGASIASKLPFGRPSFPIICPREDCGEYAAWSPMLNWWLEMPRSYRGRVASGFQRLWRDYGKHSVSSATIIKALTGRSSTRGWLAREATTPNVIDGNEVDNGIHVWAAMVAEDSYQWRVLMLQRLFGQWDSH